MKGVLQRWVCLALVSGCIGLHSARTELLKDQAATTLKRGIDFFTTHVAVEGTYLWEYSEDLTKREGEGVATDTQGWIQPPGTPAVGMAILAAHETTGHLPYLEAAQVTGNGLILGQLMSGGWYAHVGFDPSERGKLAYRLGGNPKKRNTSTLDDDITQSALRFLMRLDEALDFKDQRLHESVLLGLRSLLEAQYPNGSWPQVFRGPHDPEAYPVINAAFPDTWERTYPGHQNYWNQYTLNDNVLANVIDTLFEAELVYADSDEPEERALSVACRTAFERGGDFIMKAQMPEPQPAWAQQYDVNMHPAWARKFEPPAVTGGESQQILRTLLKLYRRTGKAKYLEPIPKALAYLKRSRLPEGKLARYYELKSNRPLYFMRDYSLTYDDSDLPTHYSFKVNDSTGAIERDYQRVRAQSWDVIREQEMGNATRVKPPTEKTVRKAINDMDELGRWLDPGPLRFHRPKQTDTQIIRCSTFIRNVELLSRYLESMDNSR